MARRINDTGQNLSDRPASGLARVPGFDNTLYTGSGNTFSVKFEKQGTYDYLCILHPWMTGTVVVTWQGVTGLLKQCKEFR
jgi:Copper binding proteins, plastocyanin/azurin family